MSKCCAAGTVCVRVSVCVVVTLRCVVLLRVRFALPYVGARLAI